MNLTLTFESGAEVDFASEVGTFRILAMELATHGLEGLADSIDANAQRVDVAVEERAAVGRAFAATIAQL
jgi:hypothetical protein